VPFYAPSLQNVVSPIAKLDIAVTTKKIQMQPKCLILFSTSNKELLAKWSRAVPREDYVFTKHSKVCFKHFEDTDVLKGYTHYVHGKPIFTPYKRFRLKPDAVPCIFPSKKDNYFYIAYCYFINDMLLDCPVYLSKYVRKRKSPTEPCDAPQKVKQPRLDKISVPISLSDSLNSNENEVQENTEITKTTNQESTTDWGMELKKINLPQMLMYQDMREQLFSFFKNR
jgi:hypothetical protein